MELILNIRQ